MARYLLNTRNRVLNFAFEPISFLSLLGIYLTKLTTQLKAIAVAAGLLASAATMAAPMNYSFAGSFAMDDDVQLFNFTANGSSNVALVSYGYAGGTQANGNVVARGGLDTILSLFNAITGASGGCSNCSFCDVSGNAAGNNLANQWAFDILNVETATVVQKNIPEPASMALFGLALAGLGLSRRARKA